MALEGRGSRERPATPSSLRPRELGRHSERNLGRTAEVGRYDLVLVDPYDLVESKPGLIEAALRHTDSAVLLLYAYNKSPRGRRHARNYEAFREPLAGQLQRLNTRPRTGEIDRAPEWVRPERRPPQKKRPMSFRISLPFPGLRRLRAKRVGTQPTATKAASETPASRVGTCEETLHWARCAVLHCRRSLGPSPSDESTRHESCNDEKCP